MIEVDHTGFDLSRFPKKVQAEETLYELSYELHVQFGSRRGVLRFLCVVDGKEASATSVSFDGQDQADVLASAGETIEADAESCVVQ